MSNRGRGKRGTTDPQGNAAAKKAKPEPNVVPQRKEHKAKHYFSVMNCFLDMATGDKVTQRTPCLVQLPTVSGLADDLYGQFDGMRAPVEGIFHLLKGSFPIRDTLPSFKQDNQSKALETLTRRIMKTKRYKLLKRVISDVDQGVIYSVKTGNYVTNKRVYYQGGQELMQLIREYGYQNKDTNEHFKNMAREVLELLREALINRHADSPGRAFWARLAEELVAIVQQFIGDDKYHREKLIQFQTTLTDLEVKLLRADTDKDKNELGDEITETKGMIRSVMSEKREYVNSHDSLPYVDDDFYVQNLKVHNNNHHIYYEYISHEMDEAQMVEWITGALPPLPETAPDEGKKRAFDFICSQLHKTPGTPLKWPWCKFHADDTYCRIPQTFRQVDVAVVYTTEMTECTGWEAWKIPILLIEVHGKKHSDPEAAILQEAAHTLIHVPRCFGLVVFKDKVKFIEFSRDPDNSAIRAFSLEMHMNGSETTREKIGLDVGIIVDHLLKCLLYGLLLDLPQAVQKLFALLQDGYKVGRHNMTEAQDVCGCCWHFKDYKDIVNRLQHPDDWNKPKEDQAKEDE